jgi:hypothetical protein
VAEEALPLWAKWRAAAAQERRVLTEFEIARLKSPRRCQTAFIRSWCAIRDHETIKVLF